MFGFLVFGTLTATLIAEMCFLYNLEKKAHEEQSMCEELEKAMDDRISEEELKILNERVDDLAKGKNCISEEEFNKALAELVTNFLNERE